MKTKVKSMVEEFKVTPWEVSGRVDYDRLVEKFGTKKIDADLLEKIRKRTKKLHPFLTRNIFFSHRDLDVVLKNYEEGRKFFLYTGRGPSGGMHIGHLIPFMFTRWLQEQYKCELYIQITDDEKFLVKDLTLEQTRNMAYDNIADIAALGFDRGKTHIFLNTEYAKTLYRIAIKVGRHLTMSTNKAIFGFTDSSNVGISFFPAMQIAPCFLPQETGGKNEQCLIPAAIDQDDYWRPARDVAPKLGYMKPAQIHSKFFPSLLGIDAKMSSSDPRSSVFLTDSPEDVEKKINRYAFSGGRDTLEEQRRLGADLEKDVPYQWLTFLEEDDRKLKKIGEDYSSGKMLTGEIKQILAEKVCTFLKSHQKARRKAESRIEKFMLRD
jgi:tryptophanyl-tRNA synthetase